MRLTRLPIEITTLLYLAMYVPYILITRYLTTTPNETLGRPFTGLEILPATLILGLVMLVIFVWVSGWWRSAHQLRVGGFSIPVPTRWTFLAGIGTSMLLFTVPLSLTFEDVSIPFMQLLMRGDVLIIAPLVDLIAGRRVRWYSWVALILVSIAMALTMWERGGLHLPPLAIAAVVLYTIGYFIRLSVMTRVAKNGDEGSLRGLLRRGKNHWHAARNRRSGARHLVAARESGRGTQLGIRAGLEQRRDLAIVLAIGGVHRHSGLRRADPAGSARKHVLCTV